MPSARRCLENSPFSALESCLARVCEAFSESSQDEIYALLWEIGSNALKYGVGVEMDSLGLADSAGLADSLGAVESANSVDSADILQTSESARFLDSALKTSAGKFAKVKAKSAQINKLEISLHIPKTLAQTSPASNTKPAPNTSPAPNPRTQNPNSQNPLWQNPSSQNPALQNPINHAAQNPDSQTTSLQNPLLPNPPFVEIIFLYFTPARFCDFRAPNTPNAPTAPRQTTSHAPQNHTRATNHQANTPPSKHATKHATPPCPLLHTHDLAALHTPRPISALDSHHNGLGGKVIRHFETIFCYDTPKVFIHSPTKRALRVRIKGAYLACKHRK